MQYFRIDGSVINNEEENSNNESKTHEFGRDLAWRIAGITEEFNQKLKKEAYIFVCRLSSGIRLGVVIKKPMDIDKLVDDFLNEIDVKANIGTRKEVILEEFQSVLRMADRNDYIYSDDDICEIMNIPDFRRGGCNIPWRENVLAEMSKSEHYKVAKTFSAKDDLCAELDRIYGCNVMNHFTGHPVHYIVETDDLDLRREIPRLLLSALHNMGRVQNRRYVFTDVRPGSEINERGYEELYSLNIGGTIIVRYGQNVESGGSVAAPENETISCLCKMARKYRNQVLTIFCFPRECKNAKEMFLEKLVGMSFVNIKEDFMYGDDAKALLKLMAKENSVRSNQKLMAKIEEGKGYLMPELREIFNTWYDNKLKKEVYSQYQELQAVKADIINKKPQGDAYAELQEMIGLKDAKKLINQAIDYQKAQRILAEKGMKTEAQAMHMVFTGSPGTAKTSVARLFASIMRENGVLSKGHLVEVGRSDLVAAYVGQTAIKVKRCFNKARGGILFIDEAYSLVDDRDGSYGDEAIATIVQEMENHRKDLIVIFAGYTNEMERFLDKNTGLRSRVAFNIRFDDYTPEELCEIAGVIAKQKGLQLSDDAKDKLAGVFEKACHNKDFGNGRYVRNVLEKAKMAQATRLLKADFDSLTKETVTTICAEDIEIPKTESQEIHSIGFNCAS